MQQECSGNAQPWGQVTERCSLGRTQLLRKTPKHLHKFNIHVLNPSHVGKGKLQELAEGHGMETHLDSKACSGVQSSHPLTPAGKKTCLLASVSAAGCDRA